MSDTKERIVKKVLICDDELQHIAEIERWFGISNENDELEFRFETESATTIEEVGEKLKGYECPWDVIVIDRRFVDEKGPMTRNLQILKPNHDLRVDAIRIVFTAFSGMEDDYANQDLIASMRLGAWDYIDKLASRKGSISSYKDVVESAIEGLREQDRRRQSFILSQEAAYWVRAHVREMQNRYKDVFVPLKKVGDGKFEVLEDAVAKTLFEVYGKTSDEDRDLVHISWFPAPKANPREGGGR